MKKNEIKIFAMSRVSSKSFSLPYNEGFIPLGISSYKIHPPPNRCFHPPEYCECPADKPVVCHIFLISVLKSNYSPTDGVYHVQHLFVEYDAAYPFALYEHINTNTVYTDSFSVHSGTEQNTLLMDLLSSSFKEKLITFTDFKGTTSASSYVLKLIDIIDNLKATRNITEKKPNPHVSPRKKAL